MSMRYFFRLLLLAWPPHARREHAVDMEDSFLAEVRAARERGVVSAVRCVAREFGALVRTGLAMRLRRSGSMQRPGRLDALGRDARLAIRTFARRPLFTALAVVPLALGIGASTAVFGIAEATLGNAAPFADPDRLVLIHAQRGGEKGRVSIREIEEMDEGLGVFDEVAFFRTGSTYTLAKPNEVAENLRATLVTHNLWRVLGVSIRLGGTWPEAYDRTRAFGTVLSHDAWQTHFGGTSEVVGAGLTLDGAPGYQVFGVAGEAFHFPVRADIYRSIFIGPHSPNREDREARNVQAVARLRPDVTSSQASAAVGRWSERVERLYPDANSGVRYALEPLGEAYVGSIRPHVRILFGASFLLLLLACANVANLLVSQGLVRSREMAVRGALGAGRARIVQQLVVEGVMLSGGGAALGLALSYGWIRAITGLVQFDLPAWMTVEVDVRVGLFAAALGIVVGVLAGLAPALRSTAIGERGVSRVAAGSRITGGAHSALRRGLVVSEIALSLVLLVGAALMGRTMLTLLRTDPGYDPTQVLAFRVQLTWSTYPPEQARLFFDEVSRELEGLPGVLGVTANSNLPISSLAVADEGIVRPVDIADASHSVQNARFQVVTASYFETMGIPLVTGRAFDSRDTSDDSHVAVVGSRLAEQLWPDGDPVGRRLHTERHGGPDSVVTVVGVAADVRSGALSAGFGTDVYFSAVQAPTRNMHVLVRTSEDPLTFAGAAHEIVRGVDPRQAVYDVGLLEQWLLDSEWQRRVSALLFGVFAGMALVLAATGIYAVVSTMVRQRRQEIGIRMAVGAMRRHILAEVLGEVAGMTAAGILLGLVGAWVLARLLAGIVYGVGTADTLTFIAVPTFMAVVVLLSSLGPARRAAVANPSDVLRRP